MAIQNISVMLTAYENNTILTGSDFIVPLGLLETDKILEISEGGISGQSSCVVFFNSSINDFSDESEPDDALHSAIQDAFEYITNWVEQRDAKTWIGFQEKGLKVQVFIDMWIDQDQVEMKFSPKFLLACSKNGIGIEFITND